MRALITGIGGFAGGHLARRLIEVGGVEIFGTTYLPVSHHTGLAAAGVDLACINLIDEDAIRNLLDDVRPDHIYHLAAQSFVPESFANPWETLSNNIRAQLNILQCMLNLKLDSRLLVISSGEVYGPVARENNPIDETQPLRPTNPYSVSKVTQDMLGLQYYLSHGLAVIRVRPFNHTGPGQSDRFVAPAFASQIARIELDQQDPIVKVGSLEAERDFTDVRDMVEAYRLIMSRGTPGDVYNVGSGVAHSIQHLLDTLIALSDQEITIEIDPDRLRPVDVPLVVCDNRKVRDQIGWQSQYDFEETMRDILDDWRARVMTEAQ